MLLQTKALAHRQSLILTVEKVPGTLICYKQATNVANIDRQKKRYEKVLVSLRKCSSAEMKQTV